MRGDRELRLGAHITFRDTRCNENAIEKDVKRKISENTASESTRTTKLHSTRLFVLSGAWTNLRGTSGYVLGLRCLVSARRSLYQSKPSIEDTNATTAAGGCKPNIQIPSAPGWSTPVVRRALRATEATSPKRPTSHSSEMSDRCRTYHAAPSRPVRRSARLTTYLSLRVAELLTPH
jgi:hypothetical protein